ncbi:MAG: PDZ domain-containing protein [Xanthomonadales bacterium]|nr:PDZ domain-containing protein [Xanthomonadales bacterium]
MQQIPATTLGSHRGIKFATKILLLLVIMACLPSPLLADTKYNPINSPINREKVDQLRIDLREMVTSARDRVFPSLVNIQVLTSRYRQGKEYKGQAVGSGTIISPEGYVLTNYHVVRNGRKFICTLANKQEVSAVLVGEDPLTDLAILKLNLEELEDKGINLSYAVLGDSEAMVIGDTVMSMGSPWALSRSVTLGIVSNTDRILARSGDDAGEMRFNRDQRTGIFTHWIQHDSAISPGNSGGPLVNLKGEVIGINAMGSSQGGMGFAIPSNLASKIATDLIEHGRVPRSWFGWKLKPIKKSGYTEGVLVNSVDEQGPAAAAGIQAGDIIVSIDEQPVTVWFPEEEPLLLARLASYPVGAKVKLTRQRGGKLAQLTLVTETLEADRGKASSFRKWGIVAIEITQSMARNRRLADTSGVLVKGIRSGSPAQIAEPSLFRDDVIIAINGQTVNSLADMVVVYEKMDQDVNTQQEVLFEFARRSRNLLTLLKIQNNEGKNLTREVSKAWIGIAVQPVLSNLAGHLGRPAAVGFRITRIYPETLAEQSKLQPGDIILAINDRQLRPQGMQDSGMLHRQVRRLEVGEVARVSVMRGDSEIEVDVTLERTRLTSAEVKREINKDFGITVREITFFDRDENRWPSHTTGVLVEDVEQAGWAQLGNIRNRDLILKINGQRIENTTQFRTAMESLTLKKQERVTVVVLRGVETRYQYLEPDWVPQVTGPSTKSTETEKS